MDFISYFGLLLDIFANLLRQVSNIGYLSLDYIYFVKLTLLEVSKKKLLDGGLIFELHFVF